MSGDGFRKVAVSINDRLKNAAKEMVREKRAADMNAAFAWVQRRFVYERLLARIAATDYASAWMVKGGVLMLALDGMAHRATRDLDVSVRPGHPDALGAVVAALKEICAAEPGQDDGLSFALDTDPRNPPKVVGEAWGHATARVPLVATLHCQRPVVVSFVLDATAAELPHLPVLRPFSPTIAGFEPARFSAYSWELAYAEKLHACVTAGENSTRLRDYGDLVVLGRSGQLDPCRAAEAVREVFASRNTEIRFDTTGMSAAWAKRRQPDWKGVLKRSGYDAALPPSFEEVLSEVRAFAQDLLAPMPGAAPASGIG